MLRAFLMAVCLLATIATQAEASPGCHSVSFKVALEVYDDFEQKLSSGLLFRVKSGSEPGWFFDIVPGDAASNDYIYPVNLPLRFNANQYLGAAYGESVKSSLAYPHDMRFLLYQTDYDHVASLIGNVLWPYQTSDPDKAVSDYKSAVKKANKGWLVVTAASHKTDAKTGELASLKLRVRVTTPLDFQFAPGLKPKRVACPSDSD
jgi:hypothetical protein